MKKKVCFTLLLICFALAGSAKKDRPSGLKNIVLRDGDMEYFMQGLVIDVPVPKNHNNDYLSIAIDNDYYDEINKKIFLRQNQKSSTTPPFMSATNC